MTSKEFSLKIENIVKEKSISHIDAVLWYCKENEIEREQRRIKKYGNLISKSLKEKIKLEATNLVDVKISNVRYQYDRKY